MANDRFIQLTWPENELISCILTFADKTGASSLIFNAQDLAILSKAFNCYKYIIQTQSPDQSLMKKVIRWMAAGIIAKKYPNQEDDWFDDGSIFHTLNTYVRKVVESLAFEQKQPILSMIDAVVGSPEMKEAIASVARGSIGVNPHAQFTLAWLEIYEKTNIPTHPKPSTSNKRTRPDF